MPAATPTSSSNSSVTSTNQESNPGNLWMFSQFHPFMLNGTSCPLDDMQNCMVLDSASSEHLFCRQDWLTNLRALAKPITLNTNGGPFQVKQEGDLQGFGAIPLDPESLTNIMSLGLIAKKYRVVMDSAVENAFTVYTEYGPVKFICNEHMLLCAFSDQTTQV